MDFDVGGDDPNVSIPRGGPIYVPDMVSALTRIPDFESSVFHELQNLKEELCCDSLEMYDDEISVEELKIIKEEDLVNRAFEEAFMGDELRIDSSYPILDNSVSNAAASERSERELCSSTPRDSSTGVCNRACHNQKSKKNHFSKRKQNPVEESYIAKVEQLARIKHKQEEDKAAARLHSFNGSCGTMNSAPKSSEKSERITSLKSISSSRKVCQVKSSSSRAHVPIQFPEVVLCVEVYRSRKPLMKSQEFLVLGQQSLTEFRDQIYCITDEIMRKADKDDPSGYFLIEDLFCNDLRDPHATDYSKPILDWLENSTEAVEKWECINSGELLQKQKAVLGNKSGLRLPRFRAVEMKNMRFCDLRFRVGAGYLYCHQGDCKHLIVIRDMRLIHPEDVQNQSAYPLLTFQLRVRLQKCSVCKIYKAEKMTVDDKWAPKNPCYFCDLCYYMLHYVNGSLLYDDFSVYDYLQD
nr:snRNA-activating protein complex subunit [Ipomoea batatas]